MVALLPIGVLDEADDGLSSRLDRRLRQLTRLAAPAPPPPEEEEPPPTGDADTVVIPGEDATTAVLVGGGGGAGGLVVEPEEELVLLPLPLPPLSRRTRLRRVALLLRPDGDGDVDDGRAVGSDEAKPLRQGSTLSAFPRSLQGILRAGGAADCYCCCSCCRRGVGAVSLSSSEPG